MYRETTPYPTEILLIKGEWAFPPFPHHTGQIRVVGITGKNAFLPALYIQECPHSLNKRLPIGWAWIGSARLGLARQALNFENYARLLRLLLLGVVPEKLRPELSTSFGTRLQPNHRMNTFGRGSDNHMDWKQGGGLLPIYMKKK